MRWSKTKNQSGQGIRNNGIGQLTQKKILCSAEVSYFVNRFLEMVLFLHRVQLKEMFFIIPMETAPFWLHPQTISTPYLSSPQITINRFD